LYREKIKQYINEKSELQNEIKKLEKENAALNRVIKRLCKNKAVAKPKPNRHSGVTERHWRSGRLNAEPNGGLLPMQCNAHVHKKASSNPKKVTDGD